MTLSRLLAVILTAIPICMTWTGPLYAQTSAARAKHVVEVLDLEGGETVADIGCGNGWLSAAVAEAVGPDGKVYAVEISEGRLKRVAARKIENIVTVHSKKDDVTLPEASIDLAFLHDVATHVDKKARPRFYASIARALEPGTGRLVIFLYHGRGAEHLAEWRRYGFTPERPSDIAGLSGKELDTRLKAGLRLRYQRIRIH